MCTSYIQSSDEEFMVKKKIKDERNFIPSVGPPQILQVVFGVLLVSMLSASNNQTYLPVFSKKNLEGLEDEY